jgi:hypothetical protein
MYNIEGKLVFSESAETNPFVITTTDIVPGLYIIEVSSAYSIKRMKITIE